MFGLRDDQLETALTGDLDAALDNASMAFDEATTAPRSTIDVEMPRPPRITPQDQDETLCIVCEPTNMED